jgi:hypothetical protein
MESPQQPVDWREKANEYWNKAKAATDYELREQFAELAARCLDMAEKLEDQEVAATILDPPPTQR